MSEEQVLVQRARNGELSAFRNLVEHYKQKVYYIAYDLTGNHHNAEDLSQEVFIKVYRSIKDYRGDAKFSSWLYRIALNTFISQSRKKSVAAVKLWNDFSENDFDNQPSSEMDVIGNPEKTAEAGLMQQHIKQALRKLAPRERSVFVLRHYNDLPLKEIAKILNVTVGTVKSTLFRSIKKLQKELSFYRNDFGMEELS